MKPGIYRDIPLEDYLRIDAANNSTLWKFRRSAAHARHSLVSPSESTDAQRMGSAIHCAILEPEKFDKTYAISPHSDRRTKAYKEWAAGVEGYEILTGAEGARIGGMKAAAWAHPLAKDLLSGKGLNEVTVIWEEDGVLCKARPDRLTTHVDWSVVVDLKKTRNGDFLPFRKSITDYGYCSQAAMQLAGLNAHSPRERRHMILTVEEEPPHCVHVFELDVEALLVGDSQFRRYLALYKAAQESGVWPGYSSGITAMSLPAWMLDEEARAE